MDTHLAYRFPSFCVANLRNSPAITHDLRLESGKSVHNLLYPELIRGSLECQHEYAKIKIRKIIQAHETSHKFNQALIAINNYAATLKL